MYCADHDDPEGSDDDSDDDSDIDSEEEVRIHPSFFCLIVKSVYI